MEHGTTPSPSILRLSHNASDGDSKCASAPCLVVPVRQKSLGAFMHLQSESRREIGSAVTPGISYAAAVENVVAAQQMANIKMAIPPRVKKQQKPAKANRRAAIDSNFTIFDEEPKPHLVMLYNKETPHVAKKKPIAERKTVQEVQQKKSQKKQIAKVVPKLLKKPELFFQPKPPKNVPQDKPEESQNDSQNESHESLSEETDFSGMELELYRARFQSTESEASFDSLPAPMDLPGANGQANSTPEFTDCESYLSYHLHRLQQILATQCSDPFWNKLPLSRKPIKKEPLNFQMNEKQYQRLDLEADAILTQTRAMHRMWLCGNIPI
ncbi:uncharacterized protein LOC117578739 [Drosophila guanche]|nr:uncharacterized protein LOC117578739 [Drosophila guanche]